MTWNGVAYGSFLSAVINFIVIGTVLFFIVKAAEKAQNLGKKEEAVEEEGFAGKLFSKVKEVAEDVKEAAEDAIEDVKKMVK